MSLALLAAVVLQSGVQVSTIRFMRWDDCVLVRNPVARLVFVPEIGRIMHYSSPVGENILCQHIDGLLRRYASHLK